MNNSNPPEARSGPPPLWQCLGEFPRPVWILFFGTFLNKFGTFVVPFLTLHLTRMGYSAAMAGVAVGVYGAGHLVASLLGGYLADTIGRRKTIILSMSSGALMLLALSQARSTPAVLALAFAVGLTAELYKPASSALLADLIPSRLRVTAYAAYRFSINAGWAFGPAVAGLLAQRSYLWLFVGDAATCAAFGVVAYLFLPRVNSPSRKAAGSNASWASDFRELTRSVLANAPFVRLWLATFALALVFVQMPTTLGLEVKAAGCSESVYGWVLGLNGLLVVLGEVPLSAFTQRFLPRPIVASGYALIGVGAGLFGWADAPAEYALAMAVFTAGEILSFSMAMAYVASIAPEAMRGRYLGLFGLTWASSLVVGPAIGAWLFSNHPNLLWTSGALLAISAGVFLAWEDLSASVRGLSLLRLLRLASPVVGKE